MAGAFGDFGTLTEAFMAAAVDPSRWDAAMDAAVKADILAYIRYVAAITYHRSHHAA